MAKYLEGIPQIQIGEDTYIKFKGNYIKLNDLAHD